MKFGNMIWLAKHGRRPVVAKGTLSTKKGLSAIFEPRHEISLNLVCATSKGSDQPAHTRSLIRAFDSRSDILCLATDRTTFGVSKLKKRLHRLV